MASEPVAAAGAASLTLGAIEAARERIRAHIRLTPCTHSVAISAMTGAEVYLKLDNQQRTGAFKERGALNKILSLTAAEVEQGVIAASAGNHAQGVAYHAGGRGIRATIVMPETTPLVKVTATARYGAQVVLHGTNYDAAYAEARRLAAELGLTFLHPFDDLEVMAGQGTLGLEMLEQVSELDAVVVPIGGGGLISGIACAVKARAPHIRVIGVQSDRMPSMQRAREHGEPVTIAAEATIADGIAVRRAGSLTFPLVQRFVDEVVTVDEEEIAKAILVLLENEKTLAEGAGAIALAALLGRKTTLAHAGTPPRVAVLVCGGNIDVSLLSRIIERGLVKDGRRMRVRIHLNDRPGSLHQLTRIIADARANIVQTAYDRLYYGVNLGDTAIEFTLETRGTRHIDELEAKLTEAGYRHERIA